MSIRDRRETRRRRRDEAREVKLSRLRQGTNIRSSPAWAIVVQALAFVRKELVEIGRQPKLILLLVVGPFLLLLLFGAGYKDTTVQLRTEFVGPAGSLYEDAVAEYADELGEYIEPSGFSGDREAAIRRLEDGEIDAVVVFPADAVDDILAGRRAKVEILHAKLDPIQQTAVNIASRLAVQEVNSRVLGSIAGDAQSALAPVDGAASSLDEQAAALSAAAAADDTSAMTEAASAVEVALDGAAVVIGTSQDVIGSLGGDVGATAGALQRVQGAREEAVAVRTATAEDMAARATALGATLQAVSAEIPQVAAVDPAVLVRPFEAATRNIAPVRIEPVDYFAPSSVALLLQHLAVTFAALSLVRDRELGLLELLRVGPLSSMEILVGKTIAYLLVGAAVSAALVAGSVLLLGVPLEGQVLWVAAAALLVLLASLMLGTVLSMISGSETQAVQCSMLTLLAGMFFSGFILDVDQLAEPYRYLSALLPVTYGINILQDVMLRGVDPARSDLIGIAALVLAYGALAIVLLRRRLRIG